MEGPITEVTEVDAKVMAAEEHGVKMLLLPACVAYAGVDSKIWECTDLLGTLEARILDQQPDIGS